MQPSNIYCKHCRKPVAAANYLIHEARCQLMSSRISDKKKQPQEQSKFSPNKKSEIQNSALRKRQKRIFQNREEQNERIPCSFCGYPQTLLELDTHPKVCEHREQECESCHSTFPRSLMNQHLQVCAVRGGHISYEQQQPDIEQDYDEQQEQFYEPYGNFQQFFRPQPRPMPRPFFQSRNQNNLGNFNVVTQSDGRGGFRQIIYSSSGSQGMNRDPIAHFFALINALAARQSQPDQGLTKQQLRQLTKINYKCNSPTGEKDICTICQCQFQDKQKVIQLRCKHLYHQECIEKWLETNGRCPVCKRPQTDRDLSNQDE